MRFFENKMPVLRRLATLALVLAVGMCVAGCMNRDEDGGVNMGKITQESPKPSPTANYMPQGTAMNSAAPAGATRFDWTQNGRQIEENIGRISEISEARVVVSGDTALVAVRFNQAYQGEMTERIREMIAAEVMQADPEITTVAVTADREDVEDVYELADNVAAGREMDDLKEEISEIVRNATTLR